MRNLLLFLLSISLFLSCQKEFLDTQEVNTPENNFEIFWNDFNDHYALFEVRGFNWDSIYSEYRPLVTNETTDEELWTVFSEMIEYLDETHTTLSTADDQRVYVSGFTLNEQAKKEFDIEVLQDNYLTNFVTVEGEENISHASIKDADIGYIWINNMGYSNPEEIDKVVTKLMDHKAIILDVRQNTGGDDFYSARIANAFSDGEHFIHTSEIKNGPNPSDFSEQKEVFTTQNGDIQFTKPVIVLTDRRTVSAGETFLIHMKAFDHVTQIGDLTSGDFSSKSMERFLPNGWKYTYSIQKILLPDGSSLDGIGHVPDVFIKNTEADIAVGRDIVIEEALEYLMANYNIK